MKPDHRLPLACVLTWAKVGYFNEPDDLTGVSHFIEHLFFKGTSKRPVGRIAQETKELGGYLNASTFYDYTFYYTVVPSQNLIGALDVQSDALMNPLFDSDEMEKEKQVIIQEVKRKFDNPDPFAWEKLLELSFHRHRVGRWRMGTEKQIEEYPDESVKDFFDRYYFPENIILAVTGNFEPEKILPEIEKRYGEMESGLAQGEDSPLEPEQKEPRLERIVGDVSQAFIKMGFHAPDLHDPNHHALNFLSILMGRGRSSRFYRSLKEEKKIAEGVGATFYAAPGVGFLTLEAELKPSKIAECEEEIWAEMDRLFRDPPSEEEMSKVRNIMEMNFFQEREDIMGQAYGLAFFEALGGYEQAQEYLEKMRSVSVEDLLRVTEEVVQFPRMNLLEYVPESFGQGAPYDQRLASLEKRVQTRRKKSDPKAEIPVSEPVAPLVFSREGEHNDIQDLEMIPLEGGVNLLYLKSKAFPVVNVSVGFPGGRSDETDENCGLTQFLLRTALKGTEHRTADEVAFEVEELGHPLHVEASADHFTFSLNMLSRNLQKGVGLLLDVILQPTFPENEIEVEREAVKNHLNRLQDNMFTYPIELFYRSLYGMHPYGLPRNGTFDSLENFSHDQLLDWYRSVFRWKKMVVSVVGDADRQQAIDLISERFSVSRDGEEESRAEILPVIPPRGLQEVIEDRNRKQTALAFGLSGVSLRDERYYDLEVLKNILSGMGGRLYMEVREKRALAYTVTAFNIGLLRGGAFFSYVAANPEKEAEVRKVLLDEFFKASTRRPTEEEVRVAKSYSLGSHDISLQGNQALANAAFLHHFSGRGMETLKVYREQIESVTAESVRSVAHQIMDVESAAVGIVRGRV